MKIYFHIGQHKTGSTAIQQFLAANQQLIALKYNMLYPNYNGTDFISKVPFHHHSFFQKIRRYSSTEEICLEFERCMHYCRQSGIENLIFSNESLFSNKIWPELIWKVLQRIKVEYQFILYLKRQDKWVESAWKERGCRDLRYNSIQEFSNLEKMDWHQKMQEWLKYFRPENFTLRCFEREMIGEDVVVDFMKILGINDLTEFDLRDRKEYLINSGFLPEVIEIFNLCKIQDETTDETFIPKNNLQSFFNRALSYKFRKEDAFKSYGMLSPAERLNIIRKYEQSNAQLSAIFFGEQRKSLFLEPLPNPNEQWKTEETLTLQKAIPVFVDLLLYLNDQIQQSAQLEHKFRTEVRDSITKQRNQVSKISAETDSLKGVMEKLTYLPGRGKLNYLKGPGHDLKYSTINLTKLISNARSWNQFSGVNINGEGLELYSTGEDPYFQIPWKLNLKRIKSLRIEMTTPGPTTLQVFYKTSYFQQFKEIFSVRQQLPTGRTTSIILFPLPVISGKLRIDPGCLPGRYIIHTIEIGS